MANNENNVELDKNGVSSVSGHSNEYSNNLSEYLYPKINSVVNEDDNGNVEFTNSEIEEYSLDVTNNKINISTTKKLIKYLKTVSKKNLKKSVDILNNEINEINDYLDNSLTPHIRSIVNNTITDKLDDVYDFIDEKANIGHMHDINDINTLSDNLDDLNDNINSKANNSDLVNHVNNRNNPHNVTLEQLGFDDTVTHKQLHSTMHLYKYGKVVSFHIINWDAYNFYRTSPKMDSNYVHVSSVNIPDGFKPNKDIYIRDIIENQHIVVGSDGKVYILVGNDVINGSKFHGQSCWVS